MRDYSWVSNAIKKGWANRKEKGTDRIPFSERLFSKISRSTSDQCWPWNGCRNKKGYGMIALPGKGNGVLLTHRAAWMVTNGDIPKGILVCHHCDNPPCCNPSHLFLGTNSQNQQDSIRKGRRPIQYYGPKGEKHFASKLTDQIVRDARRRNECGESGMKLANEYGVCFQTIYYAISRKTWRHVE